MSVNGQIREEGWQRAIELISQRHRLPEGEDISAIIEVISEVLIVRFERLKQYVLRYVIGAETYILRFNFRIGENREVIKISLVE